jgi:hypothetical protein
MPRAATPVTHGDLSNRVSNMAARSANPSAIASAIARVFPKTDS